MASSAELGCTYAALILSDDGQDINEANISKLLAAAGVDLGAETYWPSLFAGALAGVDVKQMLSSVGSGGGGGGGGGGRGDDANKLFIGGLAWATNDDNLYRAFERFKPTSSRVVMERDDPGRSRGFGFVTFGCKEDAEAAKADMDGRDVDGRSVRIDFAGDRGGGGGGGGRY